MQQELLFPSIKLSEYAYHSPETDWHFHENPYFMYLLKGAVLDQNKKSRTECERGTLVFHNWQETHYNKVLSELPRGFHIEFDRRWFEDHRLDIDLWEGSQRIECPLVHQMITKIYAEFRQKDIYSSLSIELLLFNLCEHLSSSKEQSTAHRPRWMDTLLELIHSGHQDLNLNQLSTALGVHPAHISRAVPKYLNTSLGDYIRMEKIKRSLSLLFDKNLSITEIAYSCGFSDHSHFTRTFKSYFNETPLRFRKKLVS